MGKIKRTGFTETFAAVHEVSKQNAENNDCSVKAVSIATGVPYETCLDVFTRLGRKPGGSTERTISWNAVHELGFKAYKWHWTDFRTLINEYPGIHKTLRNVTSHHPRRFPRAWSEVVGSKTLILSSSRHMLCYRDGRIHDWSVNRALRLTDIWTIERKA